MKAFIPAPTKEEPIFYCDATGEQIQCWNYYHLEGESISPHLLKLDVTLEDPNLEALQTSIKLLTSRHDSLRTCFRMEDGAVRQCVLPYCDRLVPFAFYDCSDEIERENIIERIKAVTISSKNILSDLSVAPLWRCSLFKVAESTYYFCLQIHHIISDEWSLALILKELTGFYERLLTGQPPAVEPLKMQLKDYAGWQKKWRTDNRQALSAYWLTKLSGDFGNGSGDIDKMRLSHVLDNIRPAYISYRIEQATYVGLVDLSARTRSGLLAVMVASLRLLFLKLKGKDKILISMSVVSRFFPEMESIIGYLMGGIHLFESIRADRAVDGMIKDCYLEFLESSRHIIFDHDELGLDKDLRLLCDVSINFLSKEIVGAKKMDSPEDVGHRRREEGSYYALSYHITEYEDGLSCSWLYNPGIYSSAAIDAIILMHDRILRDMYKNPRALPGEFIS